MISLYFYFLFELNTTNFFVLTIIIFKQQQKYHKIVYLVVSIRCICHQMHWLCSFFIFKRNHTLLKLIHNNNKIYCNKNVNIYFGVHLFQFKCIDFWFSIFFLNDNQSFLKIPDFSWNLLNKPNQSGDVLCNHSYNERLAIVTVISSSSKSIHMRQWALIHSKLLS